MSAYHCFIDMYFFNDIATIPETTAWVWKFELT